MLNFERLTAPEIQNFINANLNADLHSLLLKKSPFEDVSMQEIVQQIKGKKVAERKFPFLLKDGIIFPPNLNLEQTSSQATAEYKAKNLSGRKFADLTSGFGIDAFFLSENFDEVTLVEQNSDLLETVQHNWNILNRKAEFRTETLEDFLKENTQKFDLIYLDPARRDEAKKKKFLLEDLSPNLLLIQKQLLGISNKVIVKLSPLIDITYLLSEIKNIEEIKIIGVKNEVKEVVIYLNSLFTDEPKITAVNLMSAEPEFSFELNEMKIVVPEYAEPKNFLYIPNSSVLKSGAFNLVSQRFALAKLHPNTHLYTSENLIDDFPGRILKIEISSASEIKGGKFNIISKNHPLKPEEIKKKYKITDGGDKYLVFTQSLKGKVILKSQ